MSSIASVTYVDSFDNVQSDPDSDMEENMELNVLETDQQTGRRSRKRNNDSDDDAQGLRTGGKKVKINHITDEQQQALQLTVYMTAKKGNLAKFAERRAIAWDKEFRRIYGEGCKQKLTGDSVRIVCQNTKQRALLLQANNFMENEIKVTLPRAIERKNVNSQNSEQMTTPKKTLKRGIIFWVSVDFTDNELKEATKASWLKRMPKKNQDLVETPFTPVILGFEDELPDTVQLGLLTKKVHAYIPQPLQCYRCQGFGHISARCTHTEKCRRCGENHPHSQCTVIETSEKHCANCGEGHPATYKGCKKYQDVKQALEIKTADKISYADALKKIKVKNTVLQSSEQASGLVKATQTDMVTPPTANITIGDPKSKTHAQSVQRDTLPEKVGETTTGNTITMDKELLNVLTYSLYYVIENLPETSERNRVMGSLLMLTQTSYGGVLTSLKQKVDALTASAAEKHTPGLKLNSTPLPAGETLCSTHQNSI
jgi:hypothetical protein